MGEFDDGMENEEPSELAKEFAALCADVQAQIDTRVAIATQALEEAVALSEKHGVPFRPNISFLSNTYMPVSFSRSKFAKLDNEEICDIADVWGDYIFDGGGWQFSSVC